MAPADIRSEIPRTFFHVLGGLILGGAGFFLEPPWGTIFLGAAFAAVLIVEGARLASPRVNKLAGALLGPFMRPNEGSTITGAPAFFGGVFLSFLFFSRPVALAALVPLVFGDRAGLLVGKAFGKISIGKKTLEGSAACFTASFLAYLAALLLWPELFAYGLPTLAGASLVGTIAEALPRPFDDNLIIPLAVGFFLSLAG